MKKPDLIKYITLLVIITVLFIVNGLAGFLISLVTITIILLKTPKLFKMINNTGFYILFCIVIIIPLALNFSYNLLWNNSIILLRGIILVFTLYYIFNDVSSLAVYRFMKKYLPQELTIIVKTSHKTLPILSKKVKEEINTYLSEHKSIFEITYSVLRILVKASIETEELITRDQKLKVYFITGDIHSGKSTKALTTAQKAISQGFKVSGIISTGLWQDNKRCGFNVTDLSTNSSKPLITTESIDNFSESIGPYYFYPDGLDFARKALGIDKLQSSEIIFIDEIGRLELDQKGFNDELSNILSLQNAAVFIVARNIFIEEIMEKFKINPTAIIHTR